MIRRAPIALVLLALLLSAAVPLNAVRQEVTLRYRWTASQPVFYQVTQDVVNTMSGIPGMGDVRMTQTLTQVLRSVPENITADGTATLTQSVIRLRIAMGTPAGTLGYDSTNPAALQDPSGMMKNMFSAMLDQPFTVVVAPTGRVEKVDGMSKVMEKVLKTLPVDPGAGPALDAVKANISDEAMRGLFAQGFAHFPGKPVRVGETWNGEFKMTNPMMGQQVTASTYTLNALEGTGEAQTAKVGVKLTTKLEKPGAPQGPLGMTVSMSEAQGQGELSFDVPGGRLLRSYVEVDMPLTLKGTGPDGAPIELASSVKSKTTIEAVKK